MERVALQDLIIVAADIPKPESKVLKLKAVERGWNCAHPEYQIRPAVDIAPRTVETGLSLKLNDCSEPKYPRRDLLLVELEPDASNVSGDDGAPPPLESNVSNASNADGEDEQ